MYSSLKEKIKVIGVGSLGGLVAEELKSYPEYRSYKLVDSGAENNTFILGSYATMAEYEDNFPYDEVEIYLEGIREGDQVLLVIEGGDPISGSTLRLLEIISHASVSILFIKPGTSLRSESSAQNTRLAFGVLQEYARSGLLERIIFVDRERIETLVGNVPLNLYEKRIASILSYNLAMLLYFENSKSVMSSLGERPIGCRLGTLGISSLADDYDAPISLLFPLTAPRVAEFYYGIPAPEIKTNTELVTRIKSHVESNSAIFGESCSFSYSVVPLETEENYLLGIFYVSEPHLL